MRFLGLFCLLGLLLFSTISFAGEGDPCPGNAGGGDSGGGGVSTPPSGGGEGGGGGAGGGSSMDQMGRSFDPKDKGGGGDPLKDFLKSESKGSKSLMESRKREHKLEKQVQADKENFRRLQEKLQEAGRDLQRARGKTRKAEAELESTDRASTGYSEKVRDRIENLNKAVREEVWAEERFSEVEKEGLEALDKVGESTERFEAARNRLGGSTPDAQSAPPPSK